MSIHLPRVLIASLACTLTAPAAVAQIAPQPPATPEPEELVQAPPMPQRTAPAPPPPPPAPRPAAPTPPPMPEFTAPEPIIVDGQTRLRPEPTDLLAMGHNPLVNAGVVAKMAPLLSERRIAMQDLLVSTFDNTEQMLSPTFTQINLSDPSTLVQAQTVLGKLRDIGPLSQALNEARLLDTTMRRVNQAIAGEYQNALITGVRAENPDAEGEDQLRGASNAAVGGIVFEYAISEPKLAMGLLAASVMADLDAALANAEVSATSEALLRQSEATMDPGASLAAQSSAALTAFQQLTMTERKALYDYAMTQRPTDALTAPADGLSYREMTNEERTRALIHAYAGKPFNWQAYVIEDAASDEGAEEAAEED